MGRRLEWRTNSQQGDRAEIVAAGNALGSSPLALPKHAGLVLLSQALLSALAFFTSLLFIAYASRSEFGVYGMVYAAVLLSGGLQNALILTPMTVTAPTIADSERAEFVRRMSAAQGGICLLLAGLLGTATLVISRGVAVSLAVASVLAMIGAWCREFRRTERLLDGRFKRLILGDAVLVLLASAGLGALVVTGRPLTAALGLAITGLSGLITGAPSAWPKLLSVVERSRIWRTLVGLRQQIQWTVPGVAVTWMQGNAYAYIVGAALGAAQVADINTARTVIAPAVLAITAWNRYQLPRIANATYSESSGEILKHARRSRVWVAAGTAVYAIVALCLIGIFSTSAVMGKYARTGELAVPWLAFLLFSGVRSTASVPLLARGEFRQVFLFTTSSAVTTLAATVALAVHYGPIGTVWAVVGGEAMLAWLCWWGMTRCSRASVGGVALQG